MWAGDCIVQQYDNIILLLLCLLYHCEDLANDISTLPFQLTYVVVDLDRIRFGSYDNNMTVAFFVLVGRRWWHLVARYQHV